MDFRFSIEKMDGDTNFGENLEKALARRPSKLYAGADLEDSDSHSGCTAIVRAYAKGRKKRPPNKQERREDAIVFWRAMGEIAGIPSAALYIIQLRQSFITTYLSSDVIKTNKPFYHVFYWMSPQNDALHTSRDALCLLHLGLRCM
jgi:hypothetical protein